MLNEICVKNITRDLINAIGEDENRKGLEETPKRVARMYKEIMSGYDINEEEIFKTFDSEEYEGMVSVNNIFFSSICEHHLVPFMGTVEIEYRPNGKILGLSKFARLVDMFSKRLQVQERLTKQILDSIVKNLKPKYCRVSISAEHLCMIIRGIKKHGSYTITEKEYGKK